MKNNLYFEELEVHTPIGSRRWMKRRPKLKTEEKLEILKCVILENERQEDVAKMFRTSRARVSQIVMAARKKPDALREVITKDYIQATDDCELADFIEDQLN